MFLDVLLSHLEDGKPSVTESPYLPFIADLFMQDCAFLTKHPDYLLEEMGSCIELYNFIYCSQLGLNLGNWKDGDEPSVKPLYFILDNERASQERSFVRKFGYREHLKPRMAKVFPKLTMLEYLNKGEKVIAEPLWKFAQALRSCPPSSALKALDAIRAFAEKFRKDRGLPSKAIPNDPIGALDVLFEYAWRQFKPASKGRHRVMNQYMEEWHCRAFSCVLAQNVP